MANLTGQRYQDLNRVDVASIPVRDAIRVGSKAAKKTVIVLSDPTCPYCVKLHGEIKKAAAKDPDVAFLVMPYPRNPKDIATYRKCQAVICSKSEKLLDDAYAGKALPEPTCKTGAVDDTIRLTERLKIEGTPTMILPDGRMIGGYMEAEALLSLLNVGR
jgi:thiol:disulfide interchange protein DsbC